MVYYTLCVDSINRHNRVAKVEFKQAKNRLSERGLALKGLKKKKRNFEIAQNWSKHFYNWFAVD